MTGAKDSLKSLKKSNARAAAHKGGQAGRKELRKQQRQLKKQGKLQFFQSKVVVKPFSFLSFFTLITLNNAVVV
jgi:hypothetical protein